MSIKVKKSMNGFTLLEILIALFIFTILSMILASGLRSVIDTQSRTEQNAERLRTLQMTLLVMSRDIEQIVNRPVLNTAGHEEMAFVGSSTSFTFTHAGLANPDAVLARTNLQRASYTWREEGIWRTTWTELDQAPKSVSHQRKLLDNVIEATFQYLDQEGRFQKDWPEQNGDNKQDLPKAIKIRFTLAKWGTVEQLYIISAQPSKAVQSQPVQPEQPKGEQQDDMHPSPQPH